jgi:hypothetical protein
MASNFYLDSFPNTKKEEEERRKEQSPKHPDFWRIGNVSSNFVII